MWHGRQQRRRGNTDIIQLILTLCSHSRISGGKRLKFSEIAGLDKFANESSENYSTTHTSLFFTLRHCCFQVLFNFLQWQWNIRGYFVPISGLFFTFLRKQLSFYGLGKFASWKTTRSNSQGQDAAIAEKRRETWRETLDGTIRKLSNFNFLWTKTLYQNNLINVAFFFTFLKDYRCN